MRRYITEGEGLPRWTSPISHAVVTDNVCQLSGQLSIDAEGRYVKGSATDEAQRAFANLFAAVRAAGFTPSEITFIDIALVDIAELPAVNAVFCALFPADRRPARTVYEAAALPYGGRVKVMGTAIRESM